MAEHIRADNVIEIEKWIQRGLHLGSTVDDGLVPLILAAKYYAMAVTMLLLKYRADPNAKDPTGKTAMHHAALGGNAEIVRLLHQSGARTDEETDFRARTLHIAASVSIKSN